MNPESLKNTNYDFSEIDKYLSDNLPLLKRNGLAVVYKNELVFRKDYGFSDYDMKVPAKSDDVFMIYSASKPITCTAFMQLVEQGKISLSNKLCDYIPEFSHMQIKNDETGEITEAKNQITIENLLTMCSGLTYSFDDENLKKYITTHKDATTLDVVKNGIAKMNLCCEPGTRFVYSFSHDVIGALIEVVSGKTLGEYVNDNIFKPLGMNNSTYIKKSNGNFNYVAQYEDNTSQKGENAEYDRKVGNIYALTDNYESGGAGIISTIDDYIKFVAALSNYGTSYDGVHILNPETIDNIRKNRLITDKLLNSFWKSGEGYGYGLGMRTLIDGSKSNSPVGEFGWDGAASAYMFIDVENNLGIYFGMQVIHCTAGWNAHKFLRDAVYRALKIK